MTDSAETSVREFPEIERAIVYGPKPDDVIILEMRAPMTMQQTEDLKAWLRDHLGFEVGVMALARGRFGGVIRSDQGAAMRSTKQQPERDISNDQG